LRERVGVNRSSAVGLRRAFTDHSPAQTNVFAKAVTAAAVKALAAVTTSATETQRGMAEMRWRNPRQERVVSHEFEIIPIAEL